VAFTAAACTAVTFSVVAFIAVAFIAVSTRNPPQAWRTKSATLAKLIYRPSPP
jgi:hypothetical protein